MKLIIPIFVAIISSISETEGVTCLGGGCGGWIGGDYTEPRPCAGGRCNRGCPNGNCNIYPEPTPCRGGNCNIYPEPTPCRGGNCNIYPEPTPCRGGNCNIYPEPTPCRGGNCNIDPEPTPCRGSKCNDNDRFSSKTCTSCVRHCSNRCETNTCVNRCLDDCRCDEEINEDRNCCEVYHPRKCFTDEIGQKRCVVRKHRECSDLCSSRVVSIQEGGNRRGCTYVKNYPYVYCGNYEKHNCGDCSSGGSECNQQCRNILQ